MIEVCLQVNNTVEFIEVESDSWEYSEFGFLLTLDGELVLFVEKSNFIYARKIES